MEIHGLQIRRHAINVVLYEINISILCIFAETWGWGVSIHAETLRFPQPQPFTEVSPAGSIRHARSITLCTSTLLRNPFRVGEIVDGEISMVFLKQ